MKLLAMLLFAVSCNHKQLYQPKDCIRVYASITGDFYVREYFNGKYYVSPAFKNKHGESVFVNEKYELALDSTNSRKISCSEVD